MASADDRALELHRRLRGKVESRPKAELDEDTLGLLYSPGVGAASRAIADDPDAVTELTGRGNAVAVVSDGSAVLGLGDEGPLAALPVLEGKALLFRALAGIDAVPIALDVADEDAFVAAVAAIAPGFGAINLEDVAAPACFEIERRLREALDVPVVHDDQHGTAIVVVAGLVNAFRVAGRPLEDARVVIVGAGASGNATARLLHAHGVGALAVTDSHGALGPGRDDLDDVKADLVADLGLDDEGDVGDVLRGADAVVGLATPGAFGLDDVRAMADDPVVFALANPDPEVEPDDARAAGAVVVATGRSDHPNQVNNVLAFPGIFRGALDGGLREVDDAACLRAAKALAALVDDPRADRILPPVLDDGVVPAVARAVAGT
ncbi:NADP-dependent malic enzyme [Patulibacter sp. SYSU D01012]|uniref:NAD(P)-dependent malic enzyme n=1 Tax=Patulibacter sp. SYSU D01012 TaxID=2817381 RepID=UPI001B308847|nr:NADP-dependent malic enzyme [Patulibacter sp. SYSU D01012]